MTFTTSLAIGTKPLTIGMALLFTAFAFSPTFAQQGPPPALVEVESATKSVMAPSMTTPGTVVSLNDSRIAAEIAGRVTWVAPEGSFIVAGETLARIESRDLSIAVKRLNASIIRLEARVEFLSSELVRVKKLVKQGNAAESRAQQAISDLVSAQQDLEDAKLQLEQAELNLSRAEVKAPFTGRVVERFAQTGEYATPGRDIARLVDTENLEVQAQAPVRLSQFVSDGSAVQVLLAGKQVSAKVRAVVPVGDAISRTMEVRVALPSSHNLQVGAAVRVGLPADAKKEVVAVPRDALILRADGTYIFRIGTEGTAERIAVRTGASFGDEVAILGDILPGDQVVIRGGERLRPGQPVRVGESAYSR